MGLEVVKKMDAAELAAWRKGRTVDSAAGTTTPVNAPAEKEVWKRGYVRPLGAKDTQRAVFKQMWDNMRKDPDTYKAALRWMRRRQPGLGHITDDMLMDFLMKFTAETTEKNLRSRSIISPQPLDGVY